MLYLDIKKQFFKPAVKKLNKIQPFGKTYRLKTKSYFNLS